MSETLAALDIGTNSFHLLVARVDDGERFEVIAREKEMVRLGSGAGDMKRIDPEAMERGIAALGRLRQVAEAYDAPIHAVATSAVREAANAAEFLDRARREAGVDVQVVSGTEEARLIHLGVLQAVPVYDQRSVLIDIGGGSTEVFVGERGETLLALSLKLGALRLTNRFFRTTELHPSAVDACRRFLRSALAPAARGVRRHGFDVAVGSSGTIETLCAMAHEARGEGAAPRTFNNFVLARREVEAAVVALVEAGTVDERRKLPGVDAARADILLAGALIAEQAMHELGIEELVFSDNALREGALLDAVKRRRGGTLHHLRDLRRRSVGHLAGLMDDDPSHREAVAAAALELFDETRAWHGLDDDARELLEAAALLANVGQFISHSAHHKHSYYVIRNSEHLAGFTDQEVELIAVVARYHRKSPPKAGHEEFARLDEEQQRLVRVLAAILRVAIGLDRTRSAALAGLRVRSEGDGVVIELEPRRGADLDLELFSAAERTSLLEEVLGAPVELRLVPRS